MGSKGFPKETTAEGVHNHQSSLVLKGALLPATERCRHTNLSKMTNKPNQKITNASQKMVLNTKLQHKG